MSTMGNDTDIHQEVTDKIITCLESGNLLPWRKDWNDSDCIPNNPFTKTNYTGMNTLMLWIAAEKNKFSTNKWATFNQVKEAGGNVKRGSKGERILFYKPLTIDKGLPEEKKIPLLKTFTVFNLDQIEGIELKPKTVLSESLRMENIQIFINEAKADIEFGGGRACYSPMSDLIKMPLFSDFNSASGYYATLLHEHIHWTGHHTRTKRGLGGKFGSLEYANEELTAEIGSAFLCAEFDIAYAIENHASYVESWLKVLKEDKKAIFKAVSKAKEAIGFLRGINAVKEETA